MKRNITLAIDADTLEAARTLAAARKTSITKLLAEELASQVGRERQYNQAKTQALALLERKLPFGGTPLARDDLHDRTHLR